MKIIQKNTKLTGILGTENVLNCDLMKIVTLYKLLRWNELYANNPWQLGLGLVQWVKLNIRVGLPINQNQAPKYGSNFSI